MSATLHMNLGFSSGGAPIVNTLFLLDVTEVAHTEFPQGSGASIMSLIQDDSATQANKDGAKDGKIVDLLHRMLARQHSPQTPKSQWGGTFGHPGEREQEEHELHLHHGDSRHCEQHQQRLLPPAKASSSMLLLQRPPQSVQSVQSLLSHPDREEDDFHSRTFGE